MEDLLVDWEHWIAMDLGMKSTRTLEYDWNKLERRATSTIRLFLLGFMFLNVSSEDSAVNLWAKLGSLYQSKSLVTSCLCKRSCFTSEWMRMTL